MNQTEEQNPPETPALPRVQPLTFNGGGVHHDPLHEHRLRAEVKHHRLPEGSEDLGAEDHRHLVAAAVQPVVLCRGHTSRTVLPFTTTQLVSKVTALAFFPLSCCPKCWIYSCSDITATQARTN